MERSLPLSFLEWHTDAAHRRYYQQHLKHLLMEGYPCAYNALKQATHWWTAASLSIESVPRFLWSEDSKVIHIDGKPLRVKKFTEAIQKAEERARTLLYGRVFRGRKHAALEARLDRLLNPLVPDTAVQDMPQNAKPAYSFLDDPCNDFASVRGWLLGELADEFATLSDDGRPLFSTVEIKIWMADCFAFLKVRTRPWGSGGGVAHFGQAFLVAMHTSYGGPARLKELMGMLYRNARFNTRGLFIHDCLLMLVCSYRKGSSQGFDRGVIARFCSPGVTRMAVLFLVLARPLQERFAAVLFQDDAVKRARFRFFFFVADNGEQITAEQFSLTFRDSFALNTGLDVRPRDYRQFQKVCVVHYNPGAEVEEVEDDDPDRNEDGTLTASDAQMGHTHNVGLARYAVLASMPSGCAPERMSRYFSASVWWHNFADIGRHNTPSLAGKMPRELTKTVELGPQTILELASVRGPRAFFFMFFLSFFVHARDPDADAPLGTDGPRHDRAKLERFGAGSGARDPGRHGPRLGRGRPPRGSVQGRRCSGGEERVRDAHARRRVPPCGAGRGPRLCRARPGDRQARGAALVRAGGDTANDPAPAPPLF